MYQPVISIKDKRFSLYRISHYYLLLSISDSGLRIACIEQEARRCLVLEAYQIEVTNPSDYLTILKQLFQEHPFITASGWKKIVLCFENQQYTLVPGPLFQEKNSVDYLTLAVDIGAQSVKYCVHADLGLAVVFAVDQDIVSWLQDRYKLENCYVIHQASVLIASTISYLNSKKPDPAKVFVVAEPHYMHITVVEKCQLLYYNRFAYSSSDGFLQYILIVMYTLALNPSIHEVVLAGNIAKNSLAYKKIRNYIRYLSISDHSLYLKLSWAFKKDLLINYFDVLNFYPATDYLCKLKFS